MEYFDNIQRGWFTEMDNALADLKRRWQAIYDETKPHEFAVHIPLADVKAYCVAVFNGKHKAKKNIRELRVEIGRELPEDMIALDAVFHYSMDDLEGLRDIYLASTPPPADDGA